MRPVFLIPRGYTEFRYVGATRLRILGMILDGRRRCRPPRFRDMARALGCQLHNVHLHVEGLRRAGLVASESRTAGTLTPLVRFIPADRLGPSGSEGGAV